MNLLDGFGLDADISVSELRQEELLDERLHTHNRLRLRRRNDVLGVIVTVETWRDLAAYVRELESQIEHHEDLALHALIEQRSAGARFVQATDEVVAEIDRQDLRLEADE